MNTNKISNKNPTCHSLSKFYLRNKESYHKMPYLAHAQGMTGERGRSMVEMLGVLAVIGVLSVGGIAGYKVAMTKHQANELLNEASKRAVVVAAKIASGQFNASTALNEFENNTIAGAVFGAAELVGTSQFKIKFTTAPDKTICDQMKAIVGDNGIIKDWGTDCDALTYNNDLTNIDPAPAGWTAECSPACSGTDVCINGTCVAKDTAENMGCTSNSDCTGDDKDKFCSIGGTWANSCSKVQSGTCSNPDPDNASHTDPKTDNKITIGTKTFYKSYGYLDWWSAQNYCNKYHNGLASLSDIGITMPEGMTVCGSYEDEDCGYATGFSWNELQSIFNYDAFWVSDYPSGDSCYAFYVYTGDEGVYDTGRYYNYGYALCK